VTISTTVGTRLTIQQVCLTAYQVAGLRSVSQGVDDAAWQAEFRFARVLLDTMCDELAVHGVLARAVSFYEQLLEADVSAYELPDTVLDLVDPAAYIAASVTDTSRANGETVIRVVSRERWQTLSSKGASGRPTLVYPHREHDLIEARFWPIPDEAGTVRMQVHRMLADTYDASATLDLEPYWTQYVLHELASQLAGAAGIPMAAKQDMQIKANSKLELVKGKANQTTGIRRLKLKHPTGFGRRRT